MDRQDGPRGKPIRVVVVDDHAIMRAGLKAIFEKEPNIKIVGEADNGRDGVAVVRKTVPDVVIMDVRMPVLDGMAATKSIAKSLVKTKVLILSAYDTDQVVTLCLDNGAAGYLLKTVTDPQILIKAVSEIANGNSMFSPSIAKRLRDVARFSKKLPGAEVSRPELTEREAEVLQLIAEGDSNKMIAATLCISIKTVEKHRQQVMNKLGIHDVAGLSRYYQARFIQGDETKAPTKKQNGNNGNSAELTLDEKVLLVHLARGTSQESIAAELGIPIEQVRATRITIMGKLHINRDSLLVKYAEANGLLETNGRKQ